MFYGGPQACVAPTCFADIGAARRPPASGPRPDGRQVPTHNTAPASKHSSGRPEVRPVYIRRSGAGLLESSALRSSRPYQRSADLPADPTWGRVSPWLRRTGQDSGMPCLFDQTIRPGKASKRSPWTGKRRVWPSGPSWPRRRYPESWPPGKTFPMSTVTRRPPRHERA